MLLQDPSGIYYEPQVELSRSDLALTSSIHRLDDVSRNSRNRNLASCLRDCVIIMYFYCAPNTVIFCQLSVHDPWAAILLRRLDIHLTQIKYRFSQKIC
jgi:hypothetical protein